MCSGVVTLFTSPVRVERILVVLTWVVILYESHTVAASANVTATEEDVEERKITCATPPKAILDVQFLIDRSSTNVAEKAPKLLEIASLIKKQFPGSRFGMNFYSDFQCTDLYAKERCEKLVEQKTEHDDPEGCYMFSTALSENVKTIMTQAKSIPYLESAGTKAALAGIIMSAADKHVRWSEKENTAKIIFVITDAGVNCCFKEFGTREPPKGDGSDKCETMNNPTPEFVGKLLRGKGIGLFLSLSKGNSIVDTFKDWQKMAGRMRLPYGLANWGEDENAGIFKSFSCYVDKYLKLGKDGRGSNRSFSLKTTSFSNKTTGGLNTDEYTESERWREEYSWEEESESSESSHFGGSGNIRESWSSSSGGSSRGKSENSGSGGSRKEDGNSKRRGSSKGGGNSIGDGSNSKVSGSISSKRWNSGSGGSENSSGGGNSKGGKYSSGAKAVGAIKCELPPAGTKLDLMFVVDRSSQKVKDKVAHLMKITDQISKQFPGSRFGLSYFSDFQCMDWYPKGLCADIVKKGIEHDNPEGCYKFDTALGESADKVMKKVKSIPVLNSKGSESALAGIMMTSGDSKVKWKNDNNDKTRVKVIFVITDEGTNCCSKDFGTKNPPKGDGKDKCETMNNPSPELVGKLLRNKGIALFLLLSKGESEVDTFQNWNEMTERMKLSVGQANWDLDENPNVFKKLSCYVERFMRWNKKYQATRKKEIKEHIVSTNKVEIQKPEEAGDDGKRKKVVKETSEEVSFERSDSDEEEYQDRKKGKSKVAGRKEKLMGKNLKGEEKTTTIMKELEKDGKEKKVVIETSEEVSFERSDSDEEESQGRKKGKSKYAGGKEKLMGKSLKAKEKTTTTSREAEEDVKGKNVVIETSEEVSFERSDSDEEESQERKKGKSKYAGGKEKLMGKNLKGEEKTTTTTTEVPPVTTKEVEDFIAAKERERKKVKNKRVWVETTTKHESEESNETTTNQDLEKSEEVHLAKTLSKLNKKPRRPRLRQQRKRFFRQFGGSRTLMCSAPC